MLASLALAEREGERAMLAPAAEETGIDVYAEANRRARLRLTLECHAANHRADFQDVLETAPESVKPALRRAIAVSETGYERALEALD